MMIMHITAGQRHKLQKQRDDLIASRDRSRFELANDRIWRIGCVMIDEGLAGNLSDADCGEFIATMERLATRMKHVRDI